MSKTRVGILTLFVLAMAYLESAVVVYLRAIFFPEGFTFPIGKFDPFLCGVELGREAATIIMLGLVAWIASERGRGRLVSFLFLFGVWDLGYYIWLKLLLGWPPSLLTWDILFLIPVVWIAPVLAPLLVSLLFVVGSVAIFGPLNKGRRIQIDGWCSQV